MHALEWKCDVQPLIKTAITRKSVIYVIWAGCVEGPIFTPPLSNGSSQANATSTLLSWHVGYWLKVLEIIALCILSRHALTDGI